MPAVEGDEPTSTSRCPACRSLATAPAFRVRSYEIGRCSVCASLYAREPPSADELAALYADDSYFANPEFGSPEHGGYHGYRDYLADRVQIEEKFDRVLAHLEILSPGRRLLDVGSGPGFLLAAATRRGWDAVGVEPNEWAAAYARDVVGVDVRCGVLDAVELEGHFDAVTLMDVVEHFSDATELIGMVRDLLTIGGATALLTPDAGSPVSRALGRRWPEVQRVPEHLVLYSARGLASALGRGGLEAVAWHSVGKRSTVSTLVADVSPIAPNVGRWAQRRLSHSRIGDVTFELDPRTKFCLYARKGSPSPEPVARVIGHLPKRAQPRPSAEQAVVEDLRLLAGAQHLCDWMFDQFQIQPGARVAEIGAGIGTFSERLLSVGAADLLLVEPEPASATELERRFGSDLRVRIVRELLPESPTLAAAHGSFDLVLCQNVLEHIPDDGAAVQAMADALAPGGELALLVPAHPRLYGRLDVEYGHFRRYTPQRIRTLLDDAGLVVERVRSFNALALPGWWASGRRPGGRIGSTSLALFDRLVPVWRPVERLIGPPFGLSLIASARRRL